MNGQKYEGYNVITILAKHLIRVLRPCFRQTTSSDPSLRIDEENFRHTTVGHTVTKHLTPNLYKIFQRFDL